jgi:RNA polymerase sigma-70 factor (ECF subfamily)
MNDAAANLEQALPRARVRLVGLCRRLTGDPAAAEDLAQETMIEAWRHADRLRDDGSWPWLAAIARRVCTRWARRRGRELARRAGPAASDESVRGLEEFLPADDDLEVELERAELAELLDRALALLPADTRAVLIARYVEESPLADIAGRLGLSEGAVAMRLQRGKLALRRLLSADFAEALSPYGLVVVSGPAEWRMTPLYCTVCGRHRLLGRFDNGNRVIWFRCSSEQCAAGKHYGNVHFHNPISGVAPFRRAMNRSLDEVAARYLAGLPTRTLECLWCRRPLPMGVGAPPAWADNPLRPFSTSLYAVCQPCLSWYDYNVAGLAMALPQAKRFARAHPRRRQLPERELDVAGRPALLTSFEAIDSAARLDIIHDRETLRLLAVHGA